MHISHLFIHLFSPLDSADYWKEIRLSRFLGPFVSIAGNNEEMHIFSSLLAEQGQILKDVGLQSSSLEAQVLLT